MKALGKSLEQDVLHAVAIALGYLDEFKKNTVSDEDKKKYDEIEEAIAGMDLLYCELQGDVEEDADDIRELVTTYLDEESFTGNSVEIAKALCIGFVTYERAIAIFKSISNGDEQFTLKTALEQAYKEIQQKDDEDAEEESNNEV